MMMMIIIIDTQRFYPHDDYDEYTFPLPLERKLFLSSCQVLT